MSNSAKVDQKGRLKIPVTLLPMLRRSGTELYVTSEDGYSVRIYPMQVWNQVEERMEHCAHTMATTRNFLSARSISARLSR